MHKLFTIAAFLMLSQPALATVKDGVDKWSKGDYAGAVAEWRTAADAGDADAQFNLAQAYRRGQGVPADPAQVEAWYRKAALQGHLPAQANLGLMLYQRGQKEDAMPWLQAAAAQGDARAEYILGIAHYNGTTLMRDWPRAYAYMLRASEDGLAQAKTALPQMEATLPPADKQRGAAMARAVTAAGKPLPIRPGRLLSNGQVPALPAAAGATGATKPAMAAARTTPPPAVTAKIVNTPAKIASAPAITPQPPALPAPKILAAQPVATNKPNAPPPAKIADAIPVLKPDKAIKQPGKANAPLPVSSAPPMPATGKWRVQLGAFGSAAAAQGAWAKASRTPGFAALTPIYSAAGNLTRLQAGPLADKGAAQRVCTSASGSGIACFPVAVK